VKQNPGFVQEVGVSIERSLADHWAYRLLGRVIRIIVCRLPSPWVASLFKRARLNRPGEAVSSATEVIHATAGHVPVVWLSPGQQHNGVLVKLHGGAYVSGPIGNEWTFLDNLQKRCSMAAAMVIYRMPPEHPFPAALEDALIAIIAMQKSGGLREGEWILSGDSAGGGLALAVVSRMIALGRALPAGLVLTAPWVDIAMNNPAIEASERADGLLSRAWLGWAARQYAGDRTLEDPLLSPIFGSFAGFPPVHINIGTRDIFLPDVRQLKQNLLDAGVRVHYIEQEGGTHAYPVAVHTPEAQATIRSQVEWIERMIAGKN